MNTNTAVGLVGANFSTTNDARTLAWLNAAYGRHAAARQWSWREVRSSFAFTTGQQDYILTGGTQVIPDFGGIIKVSYELVAAGNIVTMGQMDEQMFLDRCSWSLTASEPLFYCIRGGTPDAAVTTVKGGGQQRLSVAPKPKASLGACFVDYYRTLSSVQLVNNADIPMMPDADQYVLVQLATAIGKMETGDADESRVFMADYREQRDQLIAQDVGYRRGDNMMLEQMRPPAINPQAGQNVGSYAPEARPLPYATT